MRDAVGAGVGRGRRSCSRRAREGPIGPSWRRPAYRPASCSIYYGHGQTTAEQVRRVRVPGCGTVSRVSAAGNGGMEGGAAPGEHDNPKDHGTQDRAESERTPAGRPGPVLKDGTGERPDGPIGQRRAVTPTNSRSRIPSGRRQARVRASGRAVVAVRVPGRERHPPLGPYDERTARAGGGL